jgi:hypothetical protein
MAQKVDYILAEECIALYKKVYQDNDINAIHKAYTTHISFPIASLNVYLHGRSLTDVINIKLGIYTKKFAEKYPGTIEGRLTAFLCPETTLFDEIPMAMDLNVGGPSADPTDSDPLNLGVLTP